jgi:hypothetical protein
MVEFKDRRDEHALRKQQLEQQQADQAEAARRSTEENQYKQQERLRAEEARKTEYNSVQAAKDVAANRYLQNLPSGQSLSPEDLAFLNRAYKDKYPELESVDRQGDTFTFTAKNGGVFKLADKTESPVIKLPKDLLEKMAITQMDIVASHPSGTKILDDLQKQFGIDPLMPTERLDRLNQQIKSQTGKVNDLRRSAEEEIKINKDSPEAFRKKSEANAAYKELEALRSEQEKQAKSLGISPGEIDYSAETEAYQNAYNDATSSGWWKSSSIGNDEMKSLDNLWSRTGRPMEEAPHRGGASQATSSNPKGGEFDPSTGRFKEGPAPVPAGTAGVVTPAPAAQPAAPTAPAAPVAADTVRLQLPDGRIVDVLAAKASAYMQAGAKAVQP